jgi:hypothetical protein
MSGLKYGCISEAAAKAKEEADSFAALRNDKQKTTTKANATAKTENLAAPEFPRAGERVTEFKAKYRGSSLRSE